MPTHPTNHPLRMAFWNVLWEEIKKIYLSKKKSPNNVTSQRGSKQLCFRGKIMVMIVTLPIRALREDLGTLLRRKRGSFCYARYEKNKTQHKRAPKPKIPRSTYIRTSLE